MSALTRRHFASQSLLSIVLMLAVFALQCAALDMGRLASAPERLSAVPTIQDAAFSLSKATRAILPEQTVKFAPAVLSPALLPEAPVLTAAPTKLLPLPRVAPRAPHTHLRGMLPFALAPPLPLVL